MQTVEHLIKLYQERGLRITPQRRYIFELLAADDSHPTVDEVYQRLRQHMPEVSRSTVYNTLHELVALGELHEVEDMSEGGTRYDTTLMHHHHLYCQNCHELIDILQPLEPINLPTETASGYKIERSQVTFYGLCPNCQLR